MVCADIFGDTAARPPPNEIIAHGGTATGATLDVSVRTDVDALAARVAGEHGGIHVWCNIAGIMVEGPFLDAPEDDLDRILAVNLKGVFFGCQAAGRIMVTNPRAAASSTPRRRPPTPPAPTS